MRVVDGVRMSTPDALGGPSLIASRLRIPRRLYGRGDIEDSSRRRSCGDQAVPAAVLGMCAPRSEPAAATSSMWWRSSPSPASNERSPAIASTPSARCPDPRDDHDLPARTPSTRSPRARGGRRAWAPRSRDDPRRAWRGPGDDQPTSADHQVGQLLAGGDRVRRAPTFHGAGRPRRRRPRTSLSLWVMKMIVVPVAVSDGSRTTPPSRTASARADGHRDECRLAIGALRISTRWRTPTGRFWIVASGSTPACTGRTGRRSAKPEPPPGRSCRSGC